MVALNLYIDKDCIDKIIIERKTRNTPFKKGVMVEVVMSLKNGTVLSDSEYCKVTEKKNIDAAEGRCVDRLYQKIRELEQYRANYDTCDLGDLPESRHAIRNIEFIKSTEGNAKILIMRYTYKSFQLTEHVSININSTIPSEVHKNRCKIAAKLRVLELEEITGG